MKVKKFLENKIRDDLLLTGLCIIRNSKGSSLGCRGKIPEWKCGSMEEMKTTENGKYVGKYKKIMYKYSI